MLKIFRKISGNSSSPTWYRRWSDAGVEIAQYKSADADVLNSPMIAELMMQLGDDGYAQHDEFGYFMDWDNLYRALSNPDYKKLHEVLAMPFFTEASPVIESNGSLSDTGFSIAISEWQPQQGRPSVLLSTGAVLQSKPLSLMRADQWALFHEIRAFAEQPEHDEIQNRMAWGRIRALAITANAQMDNFLRSTVVLTPERLQIGLNRSDVAGNNRVVEVVPSFDNVPSGWLLHFDRNVDVLDAYHLATPDGIVHVMITPQVKTVLREIKRMPGRRVAGARAEAFISNPYAALGIEAGSVIDEAQFERAREMAGLEYERFAPVFECTADGYPIKVGLLVESASSSGLHHSEIRWLDDDELQGFIQAATTALQREHQLLGWNGYEFEMQGDTPRHLDDLQAAFRIRQTPPVLVKYEQVYDLSGYSDRIEGIGKEKSVYSPYIAKKNEGDGWFPDNVQEYIEVLELDGKSTLLPTDPEGIKKLEDAVSNAESKGSHTVEVAGIPSKIPLEDAKNIVDTFKRVEVEVQGGKFDPDKPPTSTTRPKPYKRLLFKENINTLEYEQHRADALLATPQEPQIPSGIKSDISLKQHQREGLAWMQHLYSLQESFRVRGAVLADDMGLGKTFQLLALMAWLIERQPAIEPMLVVAPVSLLENWAEEAGKFFVAGALPILTAYGDALALLRVPRAQVDEKLRTEDGLVKFLKPGWIGNARVVLTTYETLRDLEFSFAAQKWSLMVCDEAQRIKNPAAMVTRAAKKQNASFKIACTGTPVENTLADLWCLFDFVQPSLLGALNEFGLRYRKPIEAKTDEEKARVAELRSKIEPQILRRMKSDVAKDLPKKIIVDECRNLPLSEAQRSFYAQAITSFKQRGTGGHTPFKNHLGLLHYLRLICTDPRPHGLNVFQAEDIGGYRKKAPKIDWLLQQLHAIKHDGEKAIVFCEFREIQRLLAHYIEEELLYKADIINGDTSASASQADSRQKRIKRFQESAGFGVIILSPVAVGFGVNIQAANHVIHYTRTWNPAKEDQATDRAYRIGQTKDVRVYYPIVQAPDFPTFDVQLDRLLEHKRELAKDMLNGSGDISSGDFGPIDGPAGGEPLGSERVTLEMAMKMDGRKFEALLSVLYCRQGYRTHLTPASNDRGVDLLVFKQGEAEGFLVQAKSSGRLGSRLGWDAIKDVVTGEAYYRNSFPRVKFTKICFTNQYFNDNATARAIENNVKLRNRDDLNSLLECYSVSLLDVEREHERQWFLPS